MTEPPRRLQTLSVATMAFVCAAILAPHTFARDDTVALINELRTRDCAHALSAAQALRGDDALDAAAKEALHGRKIDDALKRAGFRATQTAIIQFSGAVDQASLERMLRKDHCGTLTDAQLTAIGVAHGDKELAILLATPFAPPATKDARATAKEVLQLVNDARATSRHCGAQSFGPAPPLTLNEKLSAAAGTHASDLAKRGRLSHEGSDDSTPADRVTRAGYAWKVVGENVAGGQDSARKVVEGWLSSPGHCTNIMDPKFSEMGIAYFTNPKQKMGIYWVQVFGRPKQPG